MWPWFMGVPGNLIYGELSVLSRLYGCNLSGLIMEGPSSALELRVME